MLLQPGRAAAMVRTGCHHQQQRAGGGDGDGFAANSVASGRIGVIHTVGEEERPYVLNPGCHLRRAVPARRGPPRARATGLIILGPHRILVLFPSSIVG